MFRFNCRRKVKLMLCLGVAVLVTVELIKISVTVGIRGVTEVNDDYDVTESNEQIWPFPKRLQDELLADHVNDGSKEKKPEKTAGHAGAKDKKPEKTAGHGHAGSKEKKPEKTAGHGHDGSKEKKPEKTAGHGHDGSKEKKPEKTAGHGHAGSKEGKPEKTAGSKEGKDAKTVDHGHAGSKDGQKEEHPMENERELTEEEELKFLEKFLSRDDKIVVPKVDKSTGSETDGNLEEEQVEKDEEAEKLGVPATHAVKERKSTPQDTEEFEKNAEEEEEKPEKEADREQEENEDGEEDGLKNLHLSDEIEKPEKKFPQITKTSYPKGNSDDRIHVDTSRPIVNRHPFRYLIKAADVCDGSKVFVFCYVQSAVQNHKRRRRIRLTWGNRKNYPGIEIRVVFFVGQPRLDTTDGRLIQQDLLVESKKHGDIVQEDFLDAHGNLSHKGVGALKWVSTYCNHAEYVLKTDDDMFVNMYVILNHLRNIHAENFRRRLILCYVYWSIEVGQDADVPEGYFPKNTYPPYCSGMGFVMTTDVAVALYQVSRYVRFFSVNEVFIGGVLPAALQGAVNHTSWARTYCAEYEMGIYTHRTEWYKYTFTHTHDNKLILKTWRGLSDIVRNQTIPRPSVIRPGLLADEYKPLLSLFPPP